MRVYSLREAVNVWWNKVRVEDVSVHRDCVDWIEVNYRMIKIPSSISPNEFEHVEIIKLLDDQSNNVEIHSPEIILDCWKEHTKTKDTASWGHYREWVEARYKLIKIERDFFKMGFESTKSSGGFKELIKTIELHQQKIQEGKQIKTNK